MILKHLTKIWRFCRIKQVQQVTKDGESKGTELIQNMKFKKEGGLQYAKNNQQQKIDEGNFDRQNAYWAYYFIQKILNCPIHRFSQLQSNLINLKYDQLSCPQPINIKSHNYMKGFYNNFSKEGPILNSVVFSQKRFQNAIQHKNKQGRIVYYPTQVTSKMFQIFRRGISYSYFSNLRGIGKSFAIMQYCELMNLITKYRIKMKIKDQIQEIFQFQQYSMKTFYWTVDGNFQITTQKQAVQAVKKLWGIILLQCDTQFRTQHSATIQQFGKQLDNTILMCIQNEYKMSQEQFKSNIFKIVRQYQLTKFYQACSKLKQMCLLVKQFYKKKHINIMLFVDQINTIASIFRDTRKALEKLQKKQFSLLTTQQKNSYFNGRVNDDLRMILDSLGEYFFHNSSADLQDCYRYQNNQRQQIQKQTDISLKMIFGTSHTRRVALKINFANIFESNCYQQMMEMMFLSEIKKRIGDYGQFHESNCEKQIKEIIKNWFDERIYLFKIQPLLIREGIQQVDFEALKLLIAQLNQYYKIIKNMENKIENDLKNIQINPNDQSIIREYQSIAKYYNQISKIYYAKKQTKDLAQVYQNIGELYKMNERNQKIRNSYKKIVEVYKQQKEDNQNIIKNYQKIIQDYQKNNINYQSINKVYQNLLRIYYKLVNENLTNIEKQLKNKLLQIQSKIENQTKQHIKKFMQKKDQKIVPAYNIYKNMSDFVLFFATIYQYLDKKMNRQDNQKSKAFQINLNKTNIFAQLFQMKTSLNDDIVNHLICHEIFYCKDLILKSYIGDTILYKVLWSIFEEDPIINDLFNKARRTLKLTKIVRGMTGIYYEQAVMQQFQNCQKANFMFNTSYNQQDKINFHLHKTPKYFPAFNINQSNQKQESAHQTYSITKFYKIIYNQISQNYKENEFDYCVPEQTGVQNNHKKKVESQATDFILIGRREKHYQINFIQVAVGKGYITKKSDFAKLLTLLKQFYSQQNLTIYLNKQNTFSPIKINYFIIAANASQDSFLRTQQILKIAKGHIKNQELLKRFQKNFPSYLNKVGIVNFSNQNKNLIKIFHKDKIGPKSDLIALQKQTKERIKQDQEAKILSKQKSQKGRIKKHLNMK